MAINLRKALRRTGKGLKTIGKGIGAVTRATGTDINFKKPGTGGLARNTGKLIGGAVKASTAPIRSAANKARKKISKKYKRK
jgi:hypothetical protein